MRRRTLLTVLLAPLAGRAQDESWPSRTLRAIVPFPPGSATDGIARFVAERLSSRLGQPVVIKHVVGGNGLIAARQAARATPCRHTVFFATNSTHAASVHLAKEPSFDPVHSFLPVTLTSLAPLVLMVRTDFPARTVEEFIAVGRAKAGALTYQTGNIGSLAAAQLLRSLTGLAAEQISYRGTPAAVTGLLAGRLQFLVSDLTAAGDRIRAATLRALGLTSAQHIPMLPDVPTLQEAEVPGYEFASRVAVFLPARSPAGVQARLHREIRATLDSDEGERFSQSIGLAAATSTPDQPATYQSREIALWGRIAQAANLPKE